MNTDKPELTPKRIRIAFIVAVVADVCEFPIAWLETFHFNFIILTGRFFGLVLDCIVMAIMTKLLGFHWLFLPSFCVETIESLDLLPTWVGCVGVVVWQRKNGKDESFAAFASLPIVKNIALGTVSTLRRTLPLPSAPPQLPSPPAAPIEVQAQVSPPSAEELEKRLRHLLELRDKNLISQTECEARRRQILDNI